MPIEVIEIEAQYSINETLYIELHSIYKFLKWRRSLDYFYALPGVLRSARAIFALFTNGSKCDLFRFSHSFDKCMVSTCLFLFLRPPLFWCFFTSHVFELCFSWLKGFRGRHCQWNTLNADQKITWLGHMSHGFCSTTFECIQLDLYLSVFSARLLKSWRFRVREAFSGF